MNEKPRIRRVRMPQWWARSLSLLLVLLHLFSVMPDYVWAAEGGIRVTPAEPKTEALRPPDAVLQALAAAHSQTNGPVNRTVFELRPPSVTPHFTANPTDGEFFLANLFEEPLVPAAGKGMNPGEMAAENKALARAVMGYLGRTDKEDFSMFTGFLAAHPHSRWRASLLVDLGIVYRRTGYYSKAMAAWQEAWEESRDEAGQQMQAVADRAVSELAELNARLGRSESLKKVFKQLAGRRIAGSATEKLSRAREGLSMMEMKPEEAFLCGPMALSRIRAINGESQGSNPVIEAARSTPQGTSLLQVRGCQCRCPPHPHTSIDNARSARNCGT